MNSPNNQFDEEREELIEIFEHVLGIYENLLDAEIPENVKTKNLQFFDLLYVHKPSLSELEGFLSKHDYKLVKNCELGQVRDFLETNVKDIENGTIVFSPLVNTKRYIFASRESPVSKLFDTIKDIVGSTIPGKIVKE